MNHTAILLYLVFVLLIAMAYTNWLGETDFKKSTKVLIWLMLPVAPFIVVLIVLKEATLAAINEMKKPNNLQKRSE